MKAELTQAITAFTNALMHVPGTQLQTIQETLRQLRKDLTEANIPPMAELDDLIEEAEIAHAEEMAMLKDCEGPEEPDFTEEEEFYRMNYYEMYGCYPDEPKAQKAMSRILMDMFPDDLPF